MRRIIAIAVVAFGLAGAAPAQQAEVENVIRHQMDAFLADDFETAFSFASPTIKQLFRTPGNFGVMVRQGYPMVWRPADVTFLGLEPSGATAVQRVMIQDREGAVHVLAYEMISTADGWQIDGVRLLPATDVSA